MHCDYSEIKLFLFLFLFLVRSNNIYVVWRKVTHLIWKLLFRTHCNLLHTINNCYPIEFVFQKRCVKFLHSCLSSDNLIISNVAKYSWDNCYSTFGDNIRYFSHKYNIASKKWMEPFTDLLPCLFDHMHRRTPDLPVAHTIRELALSFHFFINFC